MPMSNIRSLRKAFPGTAWKVSFAEALLQLQPVMNPDAADEASDEAFTRLEHLTPEAAAAAWMEVGRADATGTGSTDRLGNDDGARRAVL